jgi:hypothetical protein
MNSPSDAIRMTSGGPRAERAITTGTGRRHGAGRDAVMTASQAERRVAAANQHPYAESATGPYAKCVIRVVPKMRPNPSASSVAVHQPVDDELGDEVHAGPGSSAGHDSTNFSGISVAFDLSRPARRDAVRLGGIL